MARPRMSEVEREHTRARIKAAAVRLYQRGGLEAVTMRAVAAELGAGPSWLYGHFKSQSEILGAVWEDTVRERFGALVAQVGQAQGALPKLRAALLGYVRFAQEEPEVFREAFLGHHDTDRRGAQSEAPFLAFVQGLVEDAAEAGEIAPGRDARVVAHMLWAAVHGAVALPRNLSNMDLLPAEAVCGPLLDALLRGLKGRPAATPGRP